MGTPLLIAVTLAYVGVAAAYWKDRRYGMVAAFIGYAVANIGFIIDMRK